jgi:hypothetical protein
MLIYLPWKRLIRESGGNRVAVRSSESQPLKRKHHCPSKHGFCLMAQDGCLFSSYSACIPASKKWENNTSDHISLTIVQLQLHLTLEEAGKYSLYFEWLCDQVNLGVMALKEGELVKVHISHLCHRPRCRAGVCCEEIKMPFCFHFFLCKNQVNAGTWEGCCGLIALRS